METGKLTALELGELLRDRQISVREGIEAVWDHIEEREERLHCYLTLEKERALARADQIQKEILAGDWRGPLMGVPFAVKDNICTKGMRTSCGSRILEHFVPAYHATAVERLEQAGAILIGKTNLDEFAMGSTTETSYFGVTRNPRDEERVPGGSSGGSAAAVAAEECFFALGSDTGGSVRQPASHCGVVGLKPSYGMVSRYGLVAYCSSMDQIGPLAKSVSDCEAVLKVIAGHDAKDGTSYGRAEEVLEKKEAGREHLNGNVCLQGIRVGVLSEFLREGVQEEVRKAVVEAAAYLQERGAAVEEVSLDVEKWIVPTYYILASAEASSNLGRYDGVKYGLREESDRLRDLYGKTRTKGFGKETKRRILLGTFVLSEGFYDAYYLKALKVRRLIRQACDKVFAGYDLLLSPVAPTTAPKLGESLLDPIRTYMADLSTAFANLAGLPAISIPFGKDEKGLPIGVQLVAEQFGEPKLLKGAKVLEQSIRP